MNFQGLKRTIAPYSVSNVELRSKNTAKRLARFVDRSHVHMFVHVFVASGESFLRLCASTTMSYTTIIDRQTLLTGLLKMIFA